MISEPLAAILETGRLSRPQVVKQLWVYIKDNALQNPSNKREIMCDDQLRAVFGVDKIDMFKMNKVLGQYVPNLVLPDNFTQTMTVSIFLFFDSESRHLHEEE